MLGQSLHSAFYTEGQSMLNSILKKKVNPKRLSYVDLELSFTCFPCVWKMLPEIIYLCDDNFTLSVTKCFPKCFPCVWIHNCGHIFHCLLKCLLKGFPCGWKIFANTFPLWHVFILFGEMFLNLFPLCVAKCFIIF